MSLINLELENEQIINDGKILNIQEIELGAVQMFVNLVDLEK